LTRTRIIDDKTIIERTSQLILKSSFELPSDVINTIKKAHKGSKNAKEKMLLNVILKNAEMAKKEKLALCQDTGISCLFVEVGTDVKTTTPINELMDKAVEKAYRSGCLRPSIIDDPLKGKNTKLNIPASISIEHTRRKGLKISFLAKGGGSENASGLFMLNPSDGFEGIKRSVLSLVKEKGPNCCPPIIVGIAIGGTADKALLSSKKALLRGLGKRNGDKYYAAKELELKDLINRTGIGVMGLGGGCTAMDVFIEALPRHIATLALGVSILCHSARRGSIEL